MNVSYKHFLFRSRKDVMSLFQKMLSDSKSVSQLTLNKTIVGYYKTNSLESTPCAMFELSNSLSQYNCLVACFVKALNSLF